MIRWSATPDGKRTSDKKWDKTLSFSVIIVTFYVVKADHHISEAETWHDMKKIFILMTMLRWNFLCIWKLEVDYVLCIWKPEVDDNLERELEQLKTSQGLLGQTSQQMAEQVVINYPWIIRVRNQSGWPNKRKLKHLKGRFQGTFPSRHTFSLGRFSPYAGSTCTREGRAKGRGFSSELKVEESWKLTFRLY